MDTNRIHRIELSKQQIRYKSFKEKIDKVFAFLALIILSPIFLVIVVAIKTEEGIKAPVFFTQKRIGENSTTFELYKFRTMKLSTPHDMPTHLLLDPTQYITKTGSRLSTKEQKNLQRNGNTAFCGVFFLPIFRFCPYYGYQHV